MNDRALRHFPAVGRAASAAICAPAEATNTTSPVSGCATAAALAVGPAPAGAVRTGDVEWGYRIAASVRAGTVWVSGSKRINVASPFGGFGRSGFGRSSGYEALMAYTQTETVWVETAAEPAVGFGYVG